MRLIPQFVHISIASAVTLAVCGHFPLGIPGRSHNDVLECHISSHGVFPKDALERPGPTCRVTNMACPMCSRPVTLAGGMAMVNGSPVAESSGAKNPCSSHLHTAI